MIWLFCSPMPHIPAERDACLFVGDGDNAEDRTKIDDTIHTYEELFRAQNITSVKEVHTAILTNGLLSTWSVSHTALANARCIVCLYLISSYMSEIERFL